MTTTITPSSRSTPALPRAATAAGLLYLATFVFSVPALRLYDGVLHEPAYVLGVGDGRGVLWGALGEVLTALACIGTAAFLYPEIRRHGPAGAIGFVASRTLEAATIFVGVVCVLAIHTLRHDLNGSDGAELTAIAQALVALKDWTFLLGPGFMPAINALCLATVLLRSGLVPRAIPAVGLIGAPLLVISFVGTLFGAWEQVSGPASLLALPIAAWELCLGLWLTARGLRPGAGRS